MTNRRIAYWMSDKKSQKINWNEFEKSCQNYGFELFKLDLNKDLHSQGPFCVLLHKLTDIIASADQGDVKCANIINKVEKYTMGNPGLIVMDPLSNVRRLLDRYVTYSIINTSNLHDYGIFTPNFCELKSTDPEQISNQLKNAGVTYPFICKPILGHGSRQAHKMSIIFNKKSLIDCRVVPCVAQSFISHNAKLYKIFLVGERYHCVERPSLKNFYACTSPTIHFDSGNVSKAGSQSSLSVLDPEDVVFNDGLVVEPNPRILETIATTLRKAFGMDLIGIDVVIENGTGKYAIIDVNAYPGYDGFPNFFDNLMECINNKINSNTNINN